MPLATSSPQPPLDVLTLRCRDAEWLDRPATVGAFRRALPRNDTRLSRHKFAPLVEVLTADAIARIHFGLQREVHGHSFLSCETARFEIPRAEPRLDARVSDWHIRAELQGELLQHDGHSGLRAASLRIQKRLVAVAGALPLLLSPALAHAGEGALQAGQTRTDSDADGTDAPAPTSAPTPARPDTQVDPAPELIAPPPQVVAPPPRVVAPPPRVVAPPAQLDQTTLSLAGENIWTGLAGKRVTLTMKNGQSLAVLIVAQSGPNLAVARASDGAVVSVPKADIAGVQMRAEAQVGLGAAALAIEPRTHQDGSRLVAGGYTMLALGGVATLAGTLILAISPYYLHISLPLLIPGLAVVGGSVSLLRAAKRKRRAYNRSWGLPEMAHIQLTPTLHAGRNGGQAGLVLRF